MIAAIFAILFGLSLLPGRKPLCLRFAEKISDGILPEGAHAYCRRLSWIWFAILSVVTLANVAICFTFREASALVRFVAPSVCSCVIIVLTFAIEARVRRRRFRVVFHTSGSTGKSKTIVKTFESLAREVAYHRRELRREWGETVKPVFLATIDPRHMYGQLWRVLLPRAMDCVCDPEIILTPESLLAKMKEHEKVFLITTPSFLMRFTAYAQQYDVPRNCIEIVTSGALLTKDVSDATERVFGIAPRQIFGSTETGGVAMRRRDDVWRVFLTVNVRAVTTPESSVTRLAVRSPYSFSRKWYVMGDGVELDHSRQTFRLLGRTDRLVKINEERVNLAEMEDRVRALGFADCAICARTKARGAYLGAVLVRAKLADGSDDISPLPTSLDMRQKLLPIFPKGTVPRQFRFVRALPRNPQGKVLTAEIAKILDSALVEPIMTNVKETADSFSADFIFDASAPYFKGHFDAQPLLPGVVQVGLATQIAENLRGRAGGLREVKKMKFMHVILPGNRIAFQLTRKSADEFVYSYRKGDVICSSGLLQF